MARLAAPGARIEDKGDSVALHFRGVAVEHESRAAEMRRHEVGDTVRSRGARGPDGLRARPATRARQGDRRPAASSPTPRCRRRHSATTSVTSRRSRRARCRPGHRPGSPCGQRSRSEATRRRPVLVAQGLVRCRPGLGRRRGRRARSTRTSAARRWRPAGALTLIVLSDPSVGRDALEPRVRPETRSRRPQRGRAAASFSPVHVERASRSLRPSRRRRTARSRGRVRRARRRHLPPRESSSTPSFSLSSTASLATRFMPSRTGFTTSTSVVVSSAIDPGEIVGDVELDRDVATARRTAR